MKLCVTAQGKDLNARVDPRFGRAAYFIIVDKDSLEFEILANENIDGTGGVGIQSAQKIAQKNVAYVLTGNIGPNASTALDAAGIRYCLGVTGTVRDAVQNFKDGKIKPASDPNACAKSGLKNE